MANRHTLLKLTLFVVLIFAPLVLASCTGPAASEKKVLRIGTEGAFPPFNYIDENNQLVGFEIDFGRAVAERMGYEAEFTTGEFGGLLTSLLANKFDVIIASMTILPERQEKANFSDWYYVDGDTIVVSKDNTTINSEQDLAGKVVGATTGTTQETAAKALDEKYGLAEIKLYPSDVEGMQDLGSGRIDAFIGAQIQMAFRIAENNEPIRIVGGLLNESFKGAAFRKEDTQLLEEFNKAFAEMIKDGSYKQLSEKWFGIYIGPE